LNNPNQLDKIYSDTNKELIIRLEKFFRALTRQFIFGDFSKDSNMYVSQIQDFSDIDDNKLGKIHYR
jgi:transposase